MFKPSKWISISFLLILAFIQSGAAKSNICTKNGEQCVFPFNYKGITYNNECVDGYGGDWCYTDSSAETTVGWAYCEACPGETTSTTTSVPSTTTTSTPAETTTTSADDTPIPKTTIQTSAMSESTSSTPVPSTIPKTSTTTTTVQPIIPTTTTTTIAPTAQSTSTIPLQSTTSTSQPLATTISISTTPTTASKIKSHLTSEVVVPPLLSVEDDSGTTIAEEDPDVTTPGPTKEPTGSRAVTPDADEVSTTTKNTEDDIHETMIVESLDGTTKLNDTTTVGAKSKTTTVFSTTVATSQPTSAKVCTESEKACDFPFEYDGKTYRTSCVSGLLYHWCYTDASIEEYSPCLPCDEDSPPTTTTTSTKTLLTTTTTTSKPKQASRLPSSSITIKQSSIAGARSTVGTVTTVATDTIKSAASAKGRDLDGRSMSDGDHDTTEVASQVTTIGKGESVQEGSGDDTSNTNTVIIVVLVLGVAAVVVILAMVIIYIRRRRNANQAELEKNGNVGESGEGLLSLNKNGNHKSINDGDSQEMKPLNPKPTEGNDDIDTGAGGDCEVINEKKDDVTANVTV